MEQNFRNHHIADADMISECFRIIHCATRDINDFARCNITPHYLFDFEAASFFFSDFFTEEEMQDHVNIITENKEGIADLIIRNISSLQAIVEGLWGKTDRYKTFGFEDMLNMADSDLILLVKRVVRVSKRFFTDLEMRGLTKEMLNVLMELEQQFLMAINLENAAVKDCDLRTSKRSLMRDNLYEVLMHLSQTGKRLYEQSNDAKYNDYLLCLEKSRVSQLPKTA